MSLDPKQTSFGRHETFPLRYAWLSKGFEAMTRDPGIFSTPDHAMVRLGVGRNMVNAIAYWLQAARLASIEEGEARPTELGMALLGSEGDPFLEDETTLWVIHWLIASNARQATGFYWFFNHFGLERFRFDDLLLGLSDVVGRELKLKRSKSTLKSDVTTLLRMYAPHKANINQGSKPGGKQRDEDHLDTPMGPLCLVEQTARTREFSSRRLPRPFLPALALHVALSECFDHGESDASPRPRAASPSDFHSTPNAGLNQVDSQAQPAIPIRELLYGRSEGGAPGAVFRLSEDGLMAALARVMETWPGQYALRDTAGIHQLYRIGAPVAPVTLLRRHHREGAG